MGELANSRVLAGFDARGDQPLASRIPGPSQRTRIAPERPTPTWRTVRVALQCCACVALLLIAVGVPRARKSTLSAMPLCHLLRGVAPLGSPATATVRGEPARIHALLRGEAHAAETLDAELLDVLRAGADPAALMPAVLRIGERVPVDVPASSALAELEPCALADDFGIAMALATEANLQRLDATAKAALAELVGAVETAHAQAESIGGLDPARRELAQRLADALARGDAMSTDDVEAAGAFDDAPSIACAQRLWIAAERARGALARVGRDAARLGFFTLPAGDAWPHDLVLALRSRAGPILVAGPGSSVIPLRGIAAVIDLGGDDVYTDAGALPGLPIDTPAATLVLDLDGDDDYVASCGGVASGISAVGVLVDGGGRDRYEARELGLCAAVLGAAILVDHAGDDRYDARTVAFGAAAFGTAVLIDVEGDDRYQARGFAFGAAADAGFGALVDATGYDLVIVAPAVIDAGEAGVAVGAVRVSPAGRPGTALWFDRRGDDILRIGNGGGGFVDGCGLALAIDAAGDDIASAGDWSLGSARAGGFALYRDLSGADRVVARRHGLGFGDAGIALAVDDGGDDERVALEPSRGTRENGGSGVFADLPDSTTR